MNSKIVKYIKMKHRNIEQTETINEKFVPCQSHTTHLFIIILLARKARSWGGSGGGRQILNWALVSLLQIPSLSKSVLQLDRLLWLL